jgi:hypothetical protein
MAYRLKEEIATSRFDVYTERARVILPGKRQVKRAGGTRKSNTRSKIWPTNFYSLYRSGSFWEGFQGSDIEINLYIHPRVSLVVISNREFT